MPSAPKPTLRFGQIAEIAQQILMIDKRETVISRLKQLQRMDVPKGCNVGRGVKLDYNLGQMLQVFLVLELGVVGVPPAIAKGLLQDGADTVAGALKSKANPRFFPYPGARSFIEIDLGRIEKMIDAALSE
jgi:hypothetical protein